MISIRTVVRVVAAHYGVSPADLARPHRHLLQRERSLAALLARRVVKPMPEWPEIGRHLGYADPSSPRSAALAAERRLLRDPYFADHAIRCADRLAAVQVTALRRADAEFDPALPHRRTA